MAKLEEYNRKRDFSKTAEPGGEVASSESGFSYLIQKHEATRLHYDFRLELDGVLLSWAVTRGPSLNPNDKRLAVQTEDHPLAYGTFEGVIPAGEYGGGTVMLWDRGFWQPEGDPVAGMKKGHLAFTLNGERLQGSWHLVRMKGKAKEKRTNWLLIKQEDDVADGKNGDKLLKKYVTGVGSGLTMAKIANDTGSKVWKSTTDKTAPATRKGKDKFPDFIPPQLATLDTAPPEGDGWLHEVKFDGYRLQAHVTPTGPKTFTRSGKDWTDKFATVVTALASLPGTAILDGEVVAMDKEGKESFRLLPEMLRGEHKANFVYYVFDLLYLDGRDLRGLPLIERKALLKDYLGTKRHKMLRYSDHITGSGKAVFKQSCSMDMEGIISKQVQGKYISGRSTGWLKSKCAKRQEMVVAGYTLPKHAGRGIGALVMGVYDGKTLRYAGRCGTGFSADEGVALRDRLEPLEVDKAVAVDVPKPMARGVRWVKPELVIEVQFTQWTDDGVLRHPSLIGVREDKVAKEVVREKAVEVKGEEEREKKGGSTKERKIAASGESKSAKKSRGKDERVEIGGVSLSSPDKVLFSDAGVTKEMLAKYYVAMAEAVLPQIAGRPLSLVRCPEGSGKPCFFQRHPNAHGSAHVRSAGVVNDDGEAYLMIDDLPGLISLVQMGALELHPWGAKADNADHPDRLIFDLDPAEDVSWADVKAAAQELRAFLEDAGLTVLLKTTGGKGLHLVVPLAPGKGRKEPEWPVIKSFTQAVARTMEEAQPDKYISKMSKAARRGKIFIDYLRNDHSATAVAAYSTRAKASGSVSMPIEWSELARLKSADAFTIKNAPARLKKKGDIWADMDEAGKANSVALAKILKGRKGG